MVDEGGKLYECEWEQLLGVQCHEKKDQCLYLARNIEVQHEFFAVAGQHKARRQARQGWPNPSDRRFFSLKRLLTENLRQRAHALQRHLNRFQVISSWWGSNERPRKRFLVLCYCGLVDG